MRTAVGADDPMGPLHRLNDLARQQAALRREEAELVRRARADGSSWQAIASALGVSRQAAHRRYGKR